MNERRLSSVDKPGVSSVMNAAARGNWELMNELIIDPHDSVLSEWIVSNLGSSYIARRVIVASVAEHMTRVPDPKVLQALHVAMTDQTGGESFLTARYLAASAVYAHGMPSSEARAVIEEAAEQTDDPALAATARHRLREIEEMKGQAHEQNPGT